MNARIDRWRQRRTQLIADRAGQFEVLSDDYLERFAGIGAYPYNPDFRIPATISITPGDTAELTRMKSAGVPQKYEDVARIVFKIEGKQYSSVALAEGSGYLLTFSDLTFTEENSPRNYSPRFLYIPMLGTAEEIILDFNMAYLPPCAFSDRFNCPLPPVNNRYEVAIKAGERAVLYKENTAQDDMRPDNSLTSCS